MAANIFSQYIQPVRSVQDYANEYARGDVLANQTAMQRSAMQQQAEAQRAAAAKQNAFMQVLNGAQGEDDVIKRLLGSSDPTLIGEGSAMDLARQKRAKEKADTGKVGADTEKTKGETVDGALNRYRGMLTYIDTPQGAARWLQAQYQDPSTGPVLQSIRGFDEAVQGIPQDPQAFQQWRQQAAVGMEKVAQWAAEMARTKLTTDTQIATNAATNATSRANNAASVGAQYANAAAQREIAKSQFDANQVSRDLQNQKLRGDIEEKQRSKQAAASNTANQIAVIDKALNHPGRETATGLSGATDPRNYVPGTNATDFKVVLDQIGGAAFLQAFESLKGGGQITEVEGKKATDAMARLSRAQSDVEFKKSLQDLRQVMTTGYKRLSGEDYKGGAPTQSGSGPVLKFDKDGNPVK